MKIEVGKTYIARNGGRDRINHVVTFPYVGDSGRTYNETGAYSHQSFEPLDLIKEAPQTHTISIDGGEDIEIDEKTWAAFQDALK